MTFSRYTHIDGFYALLFPCSPSRAAFIFFGPEGQGVCAVCHQYGWLDARLACLVWTGMCAARRDFCLPFYCYAKGFPKRFKSENPTFYDHTLGNWTVLTLQWTMSLWKVTAHTARTVLTGNGNWKLKTKTGNACALPSSTSKSIWPVEHCSVKSVRNPI